MRFSVFAIVVAVSLLIHVHVIPMVRSAALAAQSEARVVITSGLRLFDSSGRAIAAGQTIVAGQWITAGFTIANLGNLPITLDQLGVKSNPLGPSERLNNIRLNPNTSYTYRGRVFIPKQAVFVSEKDPLHKGVTVYPSGKFRLFASYRTSDGNWNDAIETVGEAKNAIEIMVRR
jgi:hypothetical protein